MKRALLVLPALATLSFAQERADVIYYNGKVVTVSKANPAAQAVAIHGNRFLAVGTDKEVLKTAGPGTRKIDLRGRSVLPGMIENHVHPDSAALTEKERPVPVYRSIADIQAYIRQEAARLPADRTIFVPKVYPSRLKEQRYPTRYDIDAAAPGRAAMCDNGYAGVLDSVLLARAGITRDTAQPPNGKIIKDERGEPTGLILGAPQLLAPFRTGRSGAHADIVWAIQAMQKAYNSAGITSIFDRSQGPAGFRAYQELHDQHKLTIRANVTYYITAKGTPKEVGEEVRRIPFVTGWGDEWLRVGPLKTTVDGGILIGTAYLREPWGLNTAVYGYRDPDFRGVLAVEKDNLFEMVKVGNELGWQLTAHTTGGGAMDLLLDAYEAADRIKPIRGRRFNLMHANFPNEECIRRAKRLGVVFDCQIAWQYCDGDTLQEVFGPERIKQLLPFRSLLDAGLVVVGGSDHMIKFDPRQATNPYHPFFAMWMMVTRKTIGGHVINPEQRVTREEALRMYTIDGAYNSFEEHVKGSIEPGKLADMVVIAKDLLTCPEDEIKDIDPLLTMVDGKVVYGGI